LNPRIFNTKIKRAHPMDDFLAKERTKIAKIAASSAPFAVAKNTAIDAAATRDSCAGYYSFPVATAGTNLSLPSFKHRSPPTTIAATRERVISRARTDDENKDEDEGEDERWVARSIESEKKQSIKKDVKSEIKGEIKGEIKDECKA
jgi:hypothetical protein